MKIYKTTPGDPARARRTRSGYTFLEILTWAILTYFRPRNPFPDSELSNSMSNYEIALGSPTFRVLGVFP